MTLRHVVLRRLTPKSYNPGCLNASEPVFGAQADTGDGGGPARKNEASGLQ